LTDIKIQSLPAFVNHNTITKQLRFLGNCYIRGRASPVCEGGVNKACPARIRAIWDAPPIARHTKKEQLPARNRRSCGNCFRMSRYRKSSPQLTPRIKREKCFRADTGCLRRSESAFPLASQPFGLFARLGLYAAASGLGVALQTPAGASPPHPAKGLALGSFSLRRGLGGGMGFFWHRKCSQHFRRNCA